MSIWVLTREINEYDQDGEYFEAAWPQKPTADQLREHVDGWHYGPDSDPVTLLLEEGGGRQGKEHTWYNLFEHGNEPKTRLSDDRIWKIAEEILDYIPVDGGSHKHLATHDNVVRAIKQALEEFSQSKD